MSGLAIALHLLNALLACSVIGSLEPLAASWIFGFSSSYLARTFFQRSRIGTRPPPPMAITAEPTTIASSA